MSKELPPRITYWLYEAKPDCFFVVGPENGPTQRIGAFKILLMGDSEPLRAMLQDSELAEKSDIRLKDVKPKTFWNFLKCVYGAEKIIIPNLNFKQSAKLLYVVEKYLVNNVKSVLTKHMNNIFSMDTFFVALSHPVCFEEKQLKQKIVDFLEYNFKYVTSHDKFLELNYSAIKLILQIECLLVKEVEIWKAVVRWAKHKTGSFDGKVLRSEMLGLLKYIRFLTMERNELNEHVLSSGILDEGEVNDLCHAFISGKQCTSENLSNNTSSRFNTVPKTKTIICSFMDLRNRACIHCTVSDISKRERNHDFYSETYCWAGYLWKLHVVRKVSEGNIDSLSVYVGCQSKELNWECSVDSEVTLINHSTKRDKTKSFFTIYRPTKKYCGFPRMIGWSDLINPDRGFVKDDCITILVRLQLEDTTSK